MKNPSVRNRRIQRGHMVGFQPEERVELIEDQDGIAGRRANKFISFLLAKHDKRQQRGALMDVHILCLDENHVVWNARIEFDDHDARLESLDTFPNKIVSAVNIDRQNVNVDRKIRFPDQVVEAIRPAEFNEPLQASDGF